jgi:hypothetical protein
MRRLRDALADGSYASLRDVVTEQYASTGTGSGKPPIRDR